MKRNFAWRKPLAFGAAAAVGCLLAAMAGEAWLAATVPPPAPPPPPPPPQPVIPSQAVVLVIDTSGSMFGGPLDEVKQAAAAYVRRQDMKKTRIGVVNFDTDAQVAAPLTRDQKVLESAINNLQLGGSTSMDLGLDTALQQLQGVPEKRNVLLFTDGVPTGGLFGIFDGQAPTLESANKIKQSGIQLIAIATGTADRAFLERVTGNPQLVFWASQGQFEEAFQKAEKVIAEPPPKTLQLVESKASENTDFKTSLGRMAVWTGLIGLGLALALVLAQKRTVRRKPGLDDVIGAAGGLLIGLLAGALSQAAFSTSAPALVGFGRMVSWSIFGGALGLGLASFVPNLRRDRAALAGAAGGALGGIGFMIAADTAGDLAGRWMGAAIVGFCIGAMIALAEVAFRRAWLHVAYGPRDAFDVNLAIRPLAVGSDAALCRVLAREALPVAARYALTEDGRAYIEDIASGKRFDVPIGDERKFGNATVTVCGELQEVQKPARLPGSAPPHLPRRAGPVSHWSLVHPTTPLQLAPQGVWTAGRAGENQIVLADQTVSSHHARLETRLDPQGPVLLVTDLNSTNGTYINGHRLEPNMAFQLNPGDSLKLGQMEYGVEAR